MRNRTIKKMFTMIATIAALCMTVHAPLAYAEEPKLQTEQQTEIRISTSTGEEEHMKNGYTEEEMDVNDSRLKSRACENR